MRYPVVAICEPTSRLRNFLQSRAAQRSWVMHVVSDMAAWPEFAVRERPSVAVLDAAAPSARLPAWLASLTDDQEDLALIVVVRAVDDALARLAQDLGAVLVLSEERLAELPAVLHQLIQSQWQTGHGPA